MFSCLGIMTLGKSTLYFEINSIALFLSWDYNSRKEHFSMRFKSRLAQQRKADLHP